VEGGILDNGFHEADYFVDFNEGPLLKILEASIKVCGQKLFQITVIRLQHFVEG
jgi:hypothetical protein